MALSAEQALLLAFRAEMGDTAWSRRAASDTPHEASSENEKEER